MPNLISIIATERTGTNYLCDLIRKTLNINGMYEIFHPDVPFGLADRIIGAALSISLSEVQGLTKKERADLVRWNAALVITALKENEERCSLFKVFPDHLPFKVVEKSILNDRDVLKIIIDRSPLDVYISQVKAGTISRWGGVDTTELRINLNYENFKEWFHSRSRWYDSCLNRLESSGQKYVVINYEQIASSPPLGLVDYFIDVCLGSGLELTRFTEKIDLSKLMRRQDRASRTQDKVNNWHEFVSSFPTKKIPESYFQGFLK